MLTRSSYKKEASLALRGPSILTHVWSSVNRIVQSSQLTSRYRHDIMVTTRSQGPVEDDSGLVLRSKAASSSPTAQSKRLRDDDTSDQSAKRLKTEDDVSSDSKVVQTADESTSAQVATATLDDVPSSSAEEFVTPPTSRSKIPRSPGALLVAQEQPLQHHDEEAREEVITSEKPARAESPLLDMFADDDPVTSDHTPLDASDETVATELVLAPVVVAAEDNEAEELPLEIIDSQEDAVSIIDPSSSIMQQTALTSIMPQVLLDDPDVASALRETMPVLSSDVQEVIQPTTTLSPSTTLEDLTLEATETEQLHMNGDAQLTILSDQAQSSLQSSATALQPTPRGLTTTTTTTQYSRRVRVPNRPIHIPKRHVTKPSSLTRYKQDMLQRHRRNQFWGGRRAEFADAR